MSASDQYASVRYLVSDVQAAIDVYTTTPADASVAGRNRIHLGVDDLDAEVDRLRGAGVTFRSDVVTGPGGSQVLVADPDGNLIELFQRR